MNCLSKETLGLVEIGLISLDAEQERHVAACATCQMWLRKRPMKIDPNTHPSEQSLQKLATETSGLGATMILKAHVVTCADCAKRLAAIKEGR